MTAVFDVLLRSRRVRYALFAVGVVSLGVTIGVFAVGVDGSSPDPIAFEETRVMSSIGESTARSFENRNLTVPKAQIFYSQHRFIVGYLGIEHAVDALQQPRHEQQYGYPIAVYVSDYAGTSPTLTDEGYLRNETAADWVAAEDAQFVIESDARTPTGETAVPFSDRSAAESFVAEYDGRIVDWATLQEHDFDIDDAGSVRDRVDDQRATADSRVESVRPLADRNVSVVVGEDTQSVQAAVDAAPPGTAIRVPEGTYNETVVVDRPVTLRGENATLEGHGEGSVVRIESDDVAVTGFTIRGIGNDTDNEDIDSDRWDEGIEAAYGYGDAGIAAANVSGVYVADVTIETPANGVLLRDVETGVVERITVDGSDEWLDGFMGVLAMRSPAVVQDSTFDGGRDGVYLAAAHGTIIRNNSFQDGRFGVHLMYTSDTLVADNKARGQELAGITIMTDPSRNAVVGNDVRNAKTGIIPAGTHSYVAENVVAGNEEGLLTAASWSLYERNVVYGNGVGIKTARLQPTNRVLRNDIVANDVPVEALAGPLRIWSQDGVGNYWAKATAGPGGPPDTYSPSDPVGARRGQVRGTTVLSRSPAATLVAAFRDTTPGMRQTEVLDTAPRAEPVQPTVLEELEEEYDE